MPITKKLPQKISEMSYVHYSVLKDMGTPREIKEFVGAERSAFSDLKKMGLITKFEGGYKIPVYIHTHRGEKVLETIENNSKIMARFEKLKSEIESKNQKKLLEKPISAFGSVEKRAG